LAKLLARHVLASNDEPAELRGLIGSTLEGVTPDILILRDQDPITSGNLGNPLGVGCVPGEMVEVNLHASTCPAKRRSYLETADLVVKEKS
jgi:hypothetical protein